PPAQLRDPGRLLRPLRQAPRRQRPRPLPDRPRAGTTPLVPPLPPPHGRPGHPHRLDRPLHPTRRPPRLTNPENVHLTPPTAIPMRLVSVAHGGNRGAKRKCCHSIKPVAFRW